MKKAEILQALDELQNQIDDTMPMSIYVDPEELAGEIRDLKTQVRELILFVKNLASE